MYKQKVLLSMLFLTGVFTSGLGFSQAVSQDAYKNNALQGVGVPKSQQEQPQGQRPTPDKEPNDNTVNQYHTSKPGSYAYRGNNYPYGYTVYQPYYASPNPSNNNAPIYIFDQYGNSLDSCPSNNFSFTQISDIYGNVIKWNETCVIQ